MRINPTIVLTLVLLTLMFGAGLLSASWGLVIGQEALKGITQPDTRPANNVANRKGAPPKHEEVVILKEDDIITTVKARMGDSGSKSAPTTAPSKPAAKPQASKAAFPVVAKSQGVVLEVSSARKQGDSVLLKVALRNTGKQPVRFLYSFLNVEDAQGKTLSASTDGLPSELPASGESFAGTIRVPADALEKSETLSLQLADYPEQQVKLEVPGIPISLQ